MVRSGAVLEVSLIAALLGSALPSGAPAYLDNLRYAWSLRPMSMEERKAALFAPWYAEATALARSVPADSAIDFVMVKPGARDIAVLAGAVLQPRDVRFFDGCDSWRSRKRAAFLHDDRAVNAAPGPAPAPAAVAVVVDAEAVPQFRVVAIPR